MINKFPQIILVYDRRKTASSTKKASVEMRITYDYKQKYISTGVKLYPDQWKDGIITNIPDALQVSQVLDKKISAVKEIIYEMANAGSIDIQSIPQKLEQKEKEKMTFIQFCESRAIIRKYGKAVDSQKRYDRFIKMFKKWNGIKYFDDVTDKAIIAYDKHLMELGLRPYSKWNNYHRFLNSFIIDAIDEGLLKRNPYKWVNIDKEKETSGIWKHLTPEEFIKLKRVKLPSKSLERIRDLFVFQTYTCMSYSDLKNFDPSGIVFIKGMRVYSGKRKKTKKTFTIPLLPAAIKILHKYDYKLPVISNVKYNDYLKIVAMTAKIDKPISSHWARHTGATLLLNEGIDLKIVSKICGHSSTRVTEQVYAKLLDETVVDAVMKIKGKR